MSSASAIIFAKCDGLFCVHVRASCYTTLFRVSLSGVGFRYVGLAQKISKAAKGQASWVPMFSPFFTTFFLSYIIIYVCFFITSARFLRFGSRI